MFQSIAARPLVLTASLLLITACDDDTQGSDTTESSSTSGSTGPGTATEGTSDSTTGATDPDPSTSDGSTTTTSDDSDSGSSGGTSGSGESSTGLEGTGSTSTGGVPIAYADLEGEYMDDFGSTHVLSVDAWVVTFGKDAFSNAIEQIDDEERWVVGFSTGGLEGYERIDWDLDGEGRLRYCSAAFGEETLLDAIDAPPSDRSDFDGVGCGGAFPWSILTPVD